jgi:hypothetical protein
MDNFQQNGFYFLLLTCFGIWGVGLLLSSLIPILNYFYTGRARTVSLDKRWNIVMSGNKARQFVCAQFCLFIGLIYYIYSWFTDHSFWIGVLVGVFSLFFMIRATIGAERIARKNILFEPGDFWHS